MVYEWMLNYLCKMYWEYFIIVHWESFNKCRAIFWDFYLFKRKEIFQDLKHMIKFVYNLASQRLGLQWGKNVISWTTYETLHKQKFDEYAIPERSILSLILPCNTRHTCTGKQMLQSVKGAKNRNETVRKTPSALSPWPTKILSKRVEILRWI